MTKEEKALKEQGRILGIRQCVAFLRKFPDEPGLADELLKWVLPHGFKVKSAMDKAYIKRVGRDLN